MTSHLINIDLLRTTIYLCQMVSFPDYRYKFKNSSFKGYLFLHRDR